MRIREMKPIFAIVFLVASVSSAVAQPTPNTQPVIPACPPDLKIPDPPTVGRRAPDLSEKLSESKGVICPPAGVDPEIAVRPPPVGDIKVITPPGTPGGDQSVQPK